jgi:hypothetical protein
VPGRGQESLQVLADRIQQALNIRIQQAPQSEPPEAVPLLGLGKPGFDIGGGPAGLATS